jgi:hypothetical protein
MRRIRRDPDPRRAATACARRDDRDPSRQSWVQRPGRMAARSSRLDGTLSQVHGTLRASAVSPGRPRPRHFLPPPTSGRQGPAPRWRCSPAIRPHGGPCGGPAIRNVRAGAAQLAGPITMGPVGPARAMARAAPRRPGPQRRPRAVVEADSPPQQ